MKCLSEGTMSYLKLFSLGSSLSSSSRYGSALAVSLNKIVNYLQIKLQWTVECGNDCNNTIIASGASSTTNPNRLGSKGLLFQISWVGMIDKYIV